MSADLSIREIETGVIVALLSKPDALYELPAGFSAEVFTHMALGRAFSAIARLVTAKQTVDLSLVAVEAKLSDTDRMLVDSTAGREYLKSLRPYAEKLLDLRRRSELRQTLVLAMQSLTGEQATADVVGGLTAKLLDLDRSDHPEVLSYRDALLSTIDAVDRVKSGKERVLRTGFEQVDRVLRIRQGNLVVLAARPKVGKTTLARQIARAVALRKEHVLMHSLEMDVSEVIALDLSAGASIDSMAFFDGTGFSDREWSAITSIGDRMLPADSNGYLHANHYHHSLGAICRITEKEHRKHPLSLVVLDYLQLVQCDLGRGATRENVVSTIARTLKLLAMRLGVPILALSQLNREAAKRGEAGKQKRSKRDPMALDGQPQMTPRSPPPQLHDLRESGAIEQDANAVVFLHHPLDDSPNRLEREHGPFEFIVAAQRLGPRGSVLLHAERQFSRFKEIA